MVNAQILKFDHGLNSGSSDFNHVTSGKLSNFSEPQFTDIYNRENCMVGVRRNGGKSSWQDSWYAAGVSAAFLSPPEVRL